MPDSKVPGHDTDEEAALSEEALSDESLSTLAGRDLSLSESLGNRIRTVARAFYREHDRLSEGLEYFIQDIYLEALIALETQDREPTGLFQIGYEWNDGSPVFDDRSTWAAVDVQYVEMDVEGMQARKREVLGERNTVEQRGDGAGTGPPSLHLDRRQAPPLGTLQYRDFAPWSPPVPQVRQSSDGERLVVTINSTHEDRHGTIILPTGGRLSSYNEGNPIVLINHDYRLPAATSSVGVRGSGFDATLQANVAEEAWDIDDPEIARWKRKIDQRIVRAASIGAIFHDVVPGRDFDRIEELLGRRPGPDEELPFVVRDWELVEWSFVSVPSNPGATVENQRLMQRLLERMGRLEQRIPQVAAPTSTTSTTVTNREQDFVLAPAASAAPDATASPSADAEEGAAESVPDEERSSAEKPSAEEPSSEEAARPPAEDETVTSQTGPPEKLSIGEARAVARELVPMIDAAVEQAINRRTGRA